MCLPCGTDDDGADLVPLQRVFATNQNLQNGQQEGHRLARSGHGLGSGVRRQAGGQSREDRWGEQWNMIRRQTIAQSKRTNLHHDILLLEK